MNNKNTNSRRLVSALKPTESEAPTNGVRWEITYGENQQTIESGLVLVGIRGNVGTTDQRSIRHYIPSWGPRRQRSDRGRKP